MTANRCTALLAMPTINDTLRAIRQKTGLSARKFADYAGFSTHSAYAYYEGASFTGAEIRKDARDRIVAALRNLGIAESEIAQLTPTIDADVRTIGEDERAEGDVRKLRQIIRRLSDLEQRQEREAQIVNQLRADISELKTLMLRLVTDKQDRDKK